MENFASKIKTEEINLTPEEEFRFEKDIQVNLIKAESIQDAKDEIGKLVELERNSTNGRAMHKIQDCMDILNLNCMGANIGNEIANTLATDLYPELYRNIALKREKVEFPNVKKMALSMELLGIDLRKGNLVENKPYDGVDPFNKIMMRDAFIKLVKLLQNGKSR